jgi:hypothetical protein
MQETIATIGMMLVKGILIPTIGLFIAWASVKLPALIGAHVKNTSVAGVLERLSTLAFSVVTEVEQTVIGKLGDKIDETTLRAARDQALATLKSHLGDKGLQEIETVLGLKDQDAVIKLLITFIESAVHNVSKSTTDVPTQPVLVTPAVPPTPTV